MKTLQIIFSLVLLTACIKNSSSNKGDRCFDGQGNNVSCEPFMKDLREKELTTNVYIGSTYFELADFQLPEMGANFRCGLSPESGKRYDYDLIDNKLHVSVDGYKLTFTNDSNNTGSLIGGIWTCTESDDPDLSSASIEFKNRRTVKITSLCSR